MTGPVLSLSLYLVLLASVSVGGFITTMPEMHRYIVTARQWMTSEDFATLFALAQAAPGPNVIIVTLLGWKLGGIVGALCTTLATCLPMFIIAYTASNVSTRFKQAPWYMLMERSVAPFALGLILTTGLILATGASSDWKGYTVTAATVIFLTTTRRSPLLPLALAAVAGYFGLL